MQQTKERSVSFGELTIDEFELGLGDNPSVKGGAPVALSQKRVGTYQIEVEHFEGLRPKRRSKSEMLLDRDTRMWM